MVAQLLNEYGDLAREAGLGNLETDKIILHNTKKVFPCSEQDRTYLSTDSDRSYGSYFADGSIFINPKRLYGEKYTDNRFAMKINKNYVKIIRFRDGQFTLERYDTKNQKYAIAFYDASKVEEKLSNVATLDNVDCMEYALKCSTMIPDRLFIMSRDKNGISVTDIDSNDTMRDSTILDNEVVVAKNKSLYSAFKDYMFDRPKNKKLYEDNKKFRLYMKK